MHDAPLEKLLVHYRPLLLKLANDRLNGPIRRKVAPSDLVQMASLKAAQAYDEIRFSHRGGFVTWLKKLLLNEANAVFRKYQYSQKRDISREHDTLSLETLEWVNQLSASVSAYHPSLGDRSIGVDDLLMAMSRLPKHYQIVLRLRYYNLEKFSTIGARIERSADAARILHQRALKRLLDELNAGGA